MSDAFVELPVDDGASADGSESDVVHVQNPSFFSHRATVEDLIASFRRNTIGPLAGVDIKVDSLPDSGTTPLLIISDAVKQRTLDCALEKWRVEQEEKELEMRWRATKRVSENWLTKVELVREKQRARREKIERELEKRKTKAGGTGGAKGNSVAKGPTMSQEKAREVISHSQPQLVTQEPQPQLAVPPHPALVLKPTQLAPPASHRGHPAPQATHEPARSHGSHRPQPLPWPLVPRPTPVRRNPSSSTEAAMPREHASASPARSNFPHAPYDPRTPDLALEELTHVPLDSGQPSQKTLPENAADSAAPAGPDSMTVTDSMLSQQDEIQNYVQQYIDLTPIQMSQSPSPLHCASPSQDSAPLTVLPSPTHNTFPEVVPDGSSGEGSVQCTPQTAMSLSGPSSQPSQLKTHPGSAPSLLLSIDPYPATQGAHDVSPVQSTLPLGPTAEEKLMWHVWSLTQAPRGTAADVILRNPHASRRSNLGPLLFKLFPNFPAIKEEVARAKISKGSPTVLEGQHASASSHQMQLPGANADSNWTWATLPFNTIHLNEPSPSMLAPRAVLVNPAHPALHQPLSSSGSQSVDKHSPSEDQSTSPVPPPITASRPTPVLKTQNLPPSLAPPHIDSPMSPSSAHTATSALLTDSSELLSPPSVLYPQYMPMGDRLFRIASVTEADVLRPSYWFEPDVMTTERMQDLVSLLEKSGGWRHPERRTRVFNGDRKARGPDDLAIVDLCFG